MARMTTPHKGPHPAHPSAARQWNISPSERERIIAENAYYRAEHRGFSPGHEAEDWLAAEEQFERLGRRSAPRGTDTVMEQGAGQGGKLGPAEDQALKRSLKARAAREISRVEGIEPDKAPRKE